MGGDASCFRGLSPLEPEGGLASVLFWGDLQSRGAMPLPDPQDFQRSRRSASECLPFHTEVSNF